MKGLITAIIALMLTSAAYAASEEIVTSDDGTRYIKGTFYKDTATNELYKVVGEDDENIYLGNYDAAVLPEQTEDVVPEPEVYGGDGILPVTDSPLSE